MSRRFGRGDYYVRTGEDVEDDPTLEARDYFVRVVAAEIPEVVTSFRADVVPRLDWLWGNSQSPWTGAATFMATTGLLGLQPVEGVESNEDLASWIRLWANRWNLAANPWFTLRLVLHAFKAYELREGLWPGSEGPDPDLSEGLWEVLGAPLEIEGVPDTLGSTWDPIESEVAPIELPGWDPTERSWGEYRKWIEGEVLPAALARERARVGEDADLQRTPRKVYDEQHFRLLARWQILEESYADLGAPDADHHLRKAIPRTSELIGLVRRTLTVI